jgi:hypothetical protein
MSAGKSLTPIQGRLINIGTQQPETAPLPTRYNNAWRPLHMDKWKRMEYSNTLAIDGST